MKDTIRYADIIETDVINGIGTSVSLWVQGCPYYCDNCYNKETWDFNAGTEINVNKLADIILGYINRDGITRNFSVLGGEPLCDTNINEVAYIINKVRDTFKNIQIFVWTGNTYENLYKQIPLKESIKSIFDNIDLLIDGPYIDEKRNHTLFLRGSENQRIINIKEMRKQNSWNDIILYNR